MEKSYIFHVPDTLSFQVTFQSSVYTVIEKNSFLYIEIKSTYNVYRMWNIRNKLFTLLRFGEKFSNL